MPRSSRRPSAYGLTVGALALLLAVVVFANSWGTFTTDTKPEVYLAPGRMLGEYLSAWTFSSFLGSASFNSGLSLVAAVTGLISSTGLSPELAFKVFHLGLWLVAATGAAALGRRLDPRLGRRGALVVAIVYVANPYSITAGATLPILLPLAWLPWQLLMLVRAAEQPRQWRWPALFGLSFFAMSGVNAGVVPAWCLLAVVPTMLFLRARHRLSWRDVVVVLARCGLFVLWLSLYWLVPSFAASATGSTIVQGTETYEVIAAPSSFSEVLRGLGLWPLYGSNDGVPWVRAHAVYLTSTPIVVATFVAVSAALAALADVPRRLARYLVALVALAAVVMVGMHPSGASSPFGRALGWSFEHVSVLSAFRTTNKIGAVLALAFALTAGLALRSWWGRVRSAAGRSTLVGAGGVLVVLVALPAFTGNLYTSPLDIPDYWKQAASSLDAEAGGSADDGTADRVMVLPGSVNPHYRWSDDRPDDILNSLFSRPTFAPVTVANTSAEGVNFTAALDDTFQSATAQGPYTSTFARYVGAGDVLLRHDTVWEDAGGIRPGGSQRTVNGDAGLVPVKNFGAPGQNVASPTFESEPFYETDVPPLQQYRVDDAAPLVRAASAADQVVVAGDGWSVPAMTRRGLLAGTPTFRYARDVAGDQWQGLLGPGHRLVLTDTNRRRAAIPSRLVDGQGPLLRADQTLPAGSRTLGTDAADQTVLRVDGGRVTASQRGYAFFDTPWGTAENAFDGDPQSSWIIGDYGRARGQHVQLDLDAPRTVSQVQVQQSDQGPVRIDRVTVTAGDVSRTVSLDGFAPTTVDLGATDADSVRVTIDSLTGQGVNSPGIAEVTVPGARVDRVAQLPRTFDDAWAGWSAQRRAEFSDTPLDVLLTRAQGALGPQDDEEQSLERAFSLPDARSFTAAAWVHLDTSAENLYDRVEGIDAGATSSGRWFDRSDLRASMAFDDDPATGWAPDVTQGATLSLAGPDRQLTSIGLDQRILPGGFQTSWVRQVEVRSDGRLLTTATLEPGDNEIPLSDDGSAVTVGDLELTVTASDPAGVGITPPLVNVDAGLTLERSTPGCIDVARVDGTALRMRPTGAASPDGSAWEACRATVSLRAGTHEVRSAGPVVVVDSFDLTDTRASAGDDARLPAFDVERGVGASMTLTPSSAATAPYVVSIGEGYDDRWRASVDGHDLGRPISVDGYSTAWLVDPADGTGPISVTFGPQRATNVALVLSGLGVLTALWLGVAPWARRRWAGLDTALVAGRGRWDALPLPRSGARPVSRSTGAGPTGRTWLATRPVRSPGRARPIVGWAAVVAAAWVLGSWPGLVAGAVLAVVHLGGGALGRPPAPRAVVRAGAALVLLSGVVWLVSLGGDRGTVTPALVTDHPWAGGLAAAGLLGVVVGVWRRHDEQ